LLPRLALAALASLIVIGAYIGVAYYYAKGTKGIGATVAMLDYLAPHGELRRRSRALPAREIDRGIAKGDRAAIHDYHFVVDGWIWPATAFNRRSTQLCDLVAGHRRQTRPARLWHQASKRTLPMQKTKDFPWFGVELLAGKYVARVRTTHGITQREFVVRTGQDEIVTIELP
jgi:hypothetical protein